MTFTICLLLEKIYSLYHFFQLSILDQLNQDYYGGIQDYYGDVQDYYGGGDEPDEIPEGADRDFCVLTGELDYTGKTHCKYLDCTQFKF